ncbi:hypothetical protein ABZ419_02475 [Streptomyces cinnamoneus]|uniref:hypothetical protein n=1 Tax=Streptomyces cinnamoneus TaxID=53446 RepID=UPI0033F402BB
MNEEQEQRDAEQGKEEGRPPLGEVVELFGFRYDLRGFEVGTMGEYWQAQRLPWLRDSLVTDDDGDGDFRTRRDALMCCTREAWYKALSVRYPVLYGPHRFSTEPVIEVLEPGYERVIWMGCEWRLYAPKLGGKRLWRIRPNGMSYDSTYGHSRAYHMHMIRGGSLAYALDPQTIRLLGTAPHTVPCVMCEPGEPGWYEGPRLKVRIGLAGRPEVDEPLCLSHVFNYYVPWEEEHRLYDMEGAWMPWRDLLHDWMYEDAEAAEAGREVPGVRRRWLAFVAEVDAGLREPVLRKRAMRGTLPGLPTPPPPSAWSGSSVDQLLW